MYFDSHLAKLEETHPLHVWPRLMIQAGAKSGMRFDVCTDLRGWLVDTGFVNVIERKLCVAIGNWPKDPYQKKLGIWNQARLDKGVRDFTERRMRNTMDVRAAISFEYLMMITYMQSFIQWENDEILVLIALAKKALRNSRLCIYQDM